MKQICVLPGDGIGPEVVECAVRVLRECTETLEFVTADIGQGALARCGASLPQQTFELMSSADSCLFGAVTSSFEEDYVSPVLTFRKSLGLYANVRPVKSILHFPHSNDVDVLIIRENTEGMYTQEEVRDELGVTTLRRVSKKATERIISFAISSARAERRSRVCCVHKSNVLKASDGLFVRTFREIMASEAPDLRPEEQLVDSAAMLLVTDPSRFDVIVTLNLYGDILSDVAAGVVGGLGFAPSGNIGDAHSVFEPSHGSAPDIAGKGIANPTAAILSGAMMLRHLGLRKDAERITKAVVEVYGSGHLTHDVGGNLGSEGFTDRVVDAVQRLEEQG